jgi:Fe-S cluster assembly protein DRE2 N-terminus
MLDRIALNFANLPPNHYTEAILALPTTEETPGEVDADYNELKSVFDKILDTMQPGGRIRIGQPKNELTKEAILAGFLVETGNEQVSSLPVALAYS